MAITVTLAFLVVRERVEEFKLYSRNCCPTLGPTMAARALTCTRTKMILGSSILWKTGNPRRINSDTRLGGTKRASPRQWDRS